MMPIHYLTNGIYRTCVLIWIVALLCVTAKPAYAYVDPGSGLFLMQVIGSTFLGFTFLIRKRIKQLFGLFAKQSKEAQFNSAPR